MQRLLLIAVMAVFVAGPACRAAEPPPEAARVSWSIERAQVLFTARRDGNSDLFVTGIQGAPRRLTTDAASENFGRPAPDGQRIAFQSRVAGGTGDIYLMDASGGTRVNLTDHPDWDVLPAWSPDGSRLAFMSTRGFELGIGGAFPGHIYVVAADGTGLRQLTSQPLASSLGPQDWTRDGHLLLSREVDGQLDLFRLDVGTGDEARLTSDPASEFGASVSPDGQQVAFHAESGDASHIVVMRADGSERRVLTPGPGRRYGPRWSPDGRWLVFSIEGEGGQYDIHALRIADGETRVIAATADDEREPDWWPGVPE